MLDLYMGGLTPFFLLLLEAKTADTSFRISSNNRLFLQRSFENLYFFKNVFVIILLCFFSHLRGGRSIFVTTSLPSLPKKARNINSTKKSFLVNKDNIFFC